MEGISILLASRRKGNPNSDLNGLLTSLQKQTSDHQSIEVIVRFDDDDDLNDILPTFSSYAFPVKYLIGSQGSGYFDLCRYYNEILPLCNRDFTMAMCVADDMVVVESGWEQKVFNAARDAGEFFILHQWLPNLNLSYEQMPGSMHRVDETPVWSRKLLELTKGISGIGSTSDVWTVIIEWILKHRFRKSITRYIHRDYSYLPIFDRKLCESDLHRIDTNLLKQRPELKGNADVSNPYFSKSDRELLNQSPASIPEWKHAKLIAEQQLGIYPYWNLLYLFLQKALGRVFNKKIDFDGISLHALDKIVYLMEPNWYGYNICCCGGTFYAVPQGEGEFILSKFLAGQYQQTVYQGKTLDEAKEKAANHKLRNDLSYRFKAAVKKRLKLFLLPIR
jgi:hypothetical protein